MPVNPAWLGQDQGHLHRNLLRQSQLLPQQNIHHRVSGQAVAEKYHGAMLTEKIGRQYYLSVLLNISALQ